MESLANGKREKIAFVTMHGAWAAVLFIRLAKDDFEVVLEGNEAHENVGKVVMMLHLMTILEVLHPLFGYTSGLNTNSIFVCSLFVKKNPSRQINDP